MEASMDGQHAPQAHRGREEDCTDCSRLQGRVVVEPDTQGSPSAGPSSAGPVPRQIHPTLPIVDDPSADPRSRTVVTAVPRPIVDTASYRSRSTSGGKHPEAPEQEMLHVASLDAQASNSVSNPSAYSVSAQHGPRK